MAMNIGSGGATGSAPALKSNFAGTRPPLPADDTSQGYAVGSRWLWPVTRSEWRCVDATTGAAVWIQADVLDHGGYVPGSQWYYPMQTPQCAAGTNPGAASSRCCRGSSRSAC